MDAGGTAVPLLGLLGNYAGTVAFRSGALKSNLFEATFENVKASHEGFKPLVREQRYDFAELAIVTYLQARACRRPYVLLPATVMARAQHQALVCNAERRQLSVGDLPGCRIGVRSYTQTTAVWLRGILEDDYGVDGDSLTWVTFDESHLAEYIDPPQCQRAPRGSNLATMLFAGELDAAIFGGDLPADPRLVPVIPNGVEAGDAWVRGHGMYPVNHMVVVRESLCDARPEIVTELFRILAEARRGAGRPAAGEPDPYPLGVEAHRKALEMIIAFSYRQKIIPLRMDVDDLFNDLTRGLGA